MNSELLYITRKLGYPSSFGARSGLGDFLEQYPDGIYVETGAGAPMGWDSAAVWFGGDSERAAARFERMMSERNELSRLFRARVSGVLVLTFIYRMKSRMVTAIPIGGAQPQPIDQTWLYFTMPEGGTVTLTKNGTPKAVTLEYSLDNGNTWTEWVETGNVRSLTLAAGQTMHVRNTSATSTEFSTSTNDYYNFAFTADIYAGGNTNSLLCKFPENAILSYNCFRNLFYNCANLISAPNLPSTIAARYCYTGLFRNCVNLIQAGIIAVTTVAESCFFRMFAGCSKLEKAPYLLFTSSYLACCQWMFMDCSMLNEIHIGTTSIATGSDFLDWLSNVSPSGDFYCPAELTIPTGTSGIPSGWTRHDI